MKCVVLYLGISLQNFVTNMIKSMIGLDDISNKIYKFFFLNIKKKKQKKNLIFL